MYEEERAEHAVAPDRVANAGQTYHIAGLSTGQALWPAAH